MDLKSSRKLICSISMELTEALSKKNTAILMCNKAAADILEVVKEISKGRLSPYAQADIEELEVKYGMLVSYGNRTFEDNEEELTYSRYCTIQILHYNNTLLEILDELSR